MASLLRKVPLTPLDALRVLLGDHAEGDPAFPTQLTQMIQSLKKEALPVLGERLAPGRSPRGLRKAILATIARFDWPEWVPWLLEALKGEGDLGIFDEGCSALGALGTRDAFEALKALQQFRSDPDHQVILSRELGLYQTQQPASHCLTRLMEGQSNPRLAAQGARLLAAMAGPSEIQAIQEAHRDGDPLTQRLALRLLGCLPGTVEFLLDLMEHSRQAYLDHRRLSDELTRLQTMPRASTQPELMKQIAAAFGTRDPKGVASLQQAPPTEEGMMLLCLEALRPGAQGVFEHFLLDALSLVVEGKVARYTAMLSEESEGTEQRLTQLTLQCDQVAEALAHKVDVGELEWERLQPVFAATFRSHAGGDGFIHAFLRRLPVTETALLDELLKDNDIGRRERYLDALGSREDNDLTAFFLKAMEDPIIEVGQRAIHHLGKLPSSFPAIMEMFEKGNQEEVRKAIWMFRENQTRMAAEPLLEFLQKEGMDLLLEEAVEALTSIGYPAGAKVMLDLLHDGKPLNLQVALARSLMTMATEEASMGLLGKAASLKQPQVLILALEGILAGFPAFDRPLPPEHLPAFLQLLERCCDDREGEGQRLRAILATQNLYVFDRQTYDQLRERFSDHLFDMRTKEAWDRDSNDRVAEVIKELGRRSDALGLLAQKEANILALMQRLPPAGPKRVEGLLALREALQDPELILRPEIAKAVAGLVREQLAQPVAEWRETAHLCEIAGRTRQVDLVEPIRDIHQRATGLGLKSAARGALLALGLTEADLNRPGPIRSILVLEPSAFFRKRLSTFLQAQSHWTVTEAGSRQEAQEKLAGDPVDLILAESQDPAGDLAPWLETQWDQRRCRYALLSTANRDIGDLAQAPWVIGTLFKPYPMDQVLAVLEH